MRGNENYARREVKPKVNVSDGQQVIKPRKRTHKNMSLNQRLVLEALRTLREASITEIALELDRTRDSIKNVVDALVRQGYITQTRKKVVVGGNGRGCTPAEYKWSGKTFPPSCLLAQKLRLADSAAFPRIHHAAPPAVEALVAGINAMVQVGRAAA